MCNPLALGILTAGTAAVSAYGQIQQGKAHAQAAEYNAVISENKAKDAENRGRVEENRKRRVIAAQMGAQRAQFGANGVQLDSGSASDILVDSAILGEQDALTIRHNSQNEANAHRSQANLTRYEGRQRRRNSNFGAFGTVLSGATKAGSFFTNRTA